MAMENWQTQHMGISSGETVEKADNITLVYWAENQYVRPGMPEFLTYYPGNIVEYQDFTLASRSTRSLPGGELSEMTLVYKPKNRGTWGNAPERKSGATVSTMEDGGLSKDIKTHDNYKAIWNHHLANRIGTTQTAPSLDSTTTAIAVPSGTTNDWAWIKDLSEKAENWEVKSTPDHKATKPGVETYTISAPTVRETTYYDNRSSVLNAGVKNGSRSVPTDTFGLPNGGLLSYWLVTSASVFYEDPFWAQDVVYQYGKNDDDIYG